MEINYKHIKDIAFPIYELARIETRPDFEDGLVLMGDLVLDDKNQKFNTLGKRRLNSPQKLFPLKRHLTGMKELILSKHKMFIDTEGKIFYYNKTLYGKVHYQKIKRCVQRDSFSTIELSMIPSPFVVPRPPTSTERWVGVLYIDEHPWQFYEYAETCLPSKRRMI